VDRSVTFVVEAPSSIKALPGRLACSRHLLNLCQLSRHLAHLYLHRSEPRFELLPALLRVLKALRVWGMRGGGLKVRGTTASTIQNTNFMCRIQGEPLS
jgi:hypothetical protein